MKKKIVSSVMWTGVAALGAAGFGMLALSRGETISAGWLVVAGAASAVITLGPVSRTTIEMRLNIDDSTTAALT